jgi:hypothetical protein
VDFRDWVPTRKDDLQPLAVGRISKLGGEGEVNLATVVDGLEQETLAEFKVKLLHRKSVDAAWLALHEGDMSDALGAAIKAAEALEL